MTRDDALSVPVSSAEQAKVQWAVRNDAGKVWRYATAAAAEQSPAASELLVKSTNGLTWEFVWTGIEPAPWAVLHG